MKTLILTLLLFAIPAWAAEPSCPDVRDQLSVRLEISAGRIDNLEAQLAAIAIQNRRLLEENKSLKMELEQKKVEAGKGK